MDDSAADFGAGVTGRLAGEVVSHIVDDQGLAQDICDSEAVCKKTQPSTSLII